MQSKGIPLQTVIIAVMKGIRKNCRRRQAITNYRRKWKAGIAELLQVNIASTAILDTIATQHQPTSPEEARSDLQVCNTSTAEQIVT